MTILKKLIPFIERIDKKLSAEYTKLNSWIFYNLKGGFKCTECGAKHLKFRTGDATTNIPHENGRDVHMILSWHGKNGPVCPICVDKAITEIFANASCVKIGDCDFTGRKNVPVIGIVWGDSNSKGINIRFGREWWNGFDASLYAFKMGIVNCEMNSTSSTYIDGKMYFNAGKNIISKTGQTYKDFYNKNFT